MTVGLIDVSNVINHISARPLSIYHNSSTSLCQYTQIHPVLLFHQRLLNDVNVELTLTSVLDTQLHGVYFTNTSLRMCTINGICNSLANKFYAVNILHVTLSDTVKQHDAVNF